ncbi:unnamed protein product [Haemonchus placei]|uniref:Uncharacterized protein n=1 Tax=Haemonchus placei TaxID=6290 RepID=A0A3P7UT45_HAEPC|nr:unnamed protein product [Haemonchus placei]
MSGLGRRLEEPGGEAQEPFGGSRTSNTGWRSGGLESARASSVF